MVKLIFSNVCGVVAKSVTRSGSPTSTGVDVSLVAVTHNQPATIDFVSLTDEQLRVAGIHMSRVRRKPDKVRYKLASTATVASYSP